MTVEETSATSLLDQLGALHHVALVVTDIEKSAGWYEEKLGWPVVRQFALPENNVAFAFLQTPGGLIYELVEIKSSEPHPSAYKHVSESGKIQGFAHVCFLVSDCDGVVAELESRGVTIIVPAHDAPDAGMRAAFFHDCDGNLIEIAQLT